MPLLFSGLSKSLKFGSSQLDFACLMTYNSRINSKYMTALKKQDKEELKSNYINRELSWLKFNDRVLFEAQNIENPLYERVKFLSIAGSNLDEFFMVRVAGLYSQIKQEVDSLSSDGLTPEEQMEMVINDTKNLLNKQNTIFNNLSNQLKRNNILLTKPENLNTKDKKKLLEIFK